MSDVNPAAETRPNAAPASSGRNRWFAVGALAVAGLAFVVITYGGIGENLVYYWGPSDLKAAGDKAVGATIRLGGLVAEDSVREGASASSLEFDVTDGQNTVHVKAHGVPPQMFREGIGVVVEGTMSRAGYFEGRRLMVSHDNEYRAPDEARTNTDIKMLIKSTQGLDD
jgi:cytochrome c-type biogenesis protein CcmE